MSPLYRFVCSAMIVAAISSGPLFAAHQPHHSAAAVDDAIAKIDPLIESIKAADAKIAPDSYDVAALAKSLGGDPTKCFEWVRDHTSWVPYRGTLRGATGTLVDGTGDSLDRALLLAEMLRASGRPARLARAQLADDVARQTLERLSQRPTSSSAIPAMKDNNAERQRSREELATRARKQAALLVSAVPSPGADAVRATEESSARQAIADHWWVQYREGGEQWIDLDPTAPDAKPGATLTRATETIDLTDPKQLVALNERFGHGVVVRVFVEQWKDGKLAEHKVLETALRPADVLGQRVALNHAPMNWPAEQKNADDPAADLARLKAAVLAQKEWLPVLTVGTTQVAQAGFSDQGEIDSNPQKPALAAVGKSVGGAMKSALDAFGGGGADATPTAPAAPAPAGSGKLTAEWIEYEIRAYGEPPRTVRRQIFDLIGPAARARDAAKEPSIDDDAKFTAGLAMLNEVDILVSPGRLSPQYAAHVTFADLVVQQEAFRAFLTRAKSPGSQLSTTDNVKPFRPICAPLLGMAVARFDALNPSRDSVFVDRPNVFAYHVGTALGADGQPKVVRAFDVVANDVGVRPHAWGDAYRLRVAQGVTDTNLETLFTGGAADRRNNTADLLGAAGDDGAKSWVALRSANDAALSNVTLPDDALVRIHAATSAGMVAFAPPRATDDGGTVAWWVIDPKTGSTLGIGANGWGVDLSEESALLNRIAVFVEENKTWICMGQVYYGAVALIATALGDPAVGALADQIADILTAVCGEP